MRLEWSLTSLADRDAIYDYISADSRRAALHVDEAIEQQTDGLSEHPHRGREGRVGGTRELIIVSTPYLVVYTVEAERVLVLRVLHGAQFWPDTSA